MICLKKQLSIAHRMANYEILTGPLAGEVAEEGQILDLDYKDLPFDWKLMIVEWADENPKYKRIAPFFYQHSQSGRLVLLDDIKADYETSWQTKETDSPPTIQPASNWVV